MLTTTPSRNEGRAKPRVATPVRIVSATAALSVLTVTFDQPVILKGTPAFTTDVAGATPVSATLTSPTTLSVTFSAQITAATELRIPFQSPAIRNAVGGFIADSTFPV
jgi:hypothetical protein